jgi:ribosomal protein L16/L10AE
LSKPIAEILIPLLENATKKASGEFKLKEKYEKINCEISAASLESARARLERYLPNTSRAKE